MDQVNISSTMLVLSLFFWLGVFVVVSSIINMILKRSVVNGAGWFFWIALALFTWSTIIILRPKPGTIPEVDPLIYVGQLISAYLFPVLFAGYFALKFRKKKKLKAINTNNKNPNFVDDAQTKEPQGKSDASSSKNKAI